jgi:hypothetical protein
MNEENSQELLNIVLHLTQMEAHYLNAAVVEFFHKMKSSVESETLVPNMDKRYNVSKSLWAKVEKMIPLTDIK